MTELLHDTVMLSRLQFAVTTMFHIIWPLLTIGLSVYLVVLEGLWLKTGDQGYMRQFGFWSKLFAVGFAVGVVSGIPLEFQFGTNWAPFSQAAGNFLGHVLSFEGAMAFMLESAFLSIMLWGRGRVGPRMHFLATVLVCLAASLSAFWIMAANSWMQTPAGGRFEGGVFILEDFLAAVFNPDTALSFAHMWVACLETSLFAVGAVCAWQMLRGRDVDFFLRAFKLAFVMALAVAPLQALVGDASGVALGKHQPLKVAAIESHWETNPPGVPAAWNMLAWPDEKAEKNVFQIEIPYVLSLLITHTPTGTVPGLKDFPADTRPPIVIPFYTFRGMVGIGFIMVGVVALTALAWRAGRLKPEGLSTIRPLLWLWVAMGPMGIIATELGWITREVGRQPWIIYGHMRTAEAASALPPAAVGASLAAFLALYAVLPAAALYFMGRILRQGPEPLETPAPNPAPKG